MGITVLYTGKKSAFSYVYTLHLVKHSTELAELIVSYLTTSLLVKTVV